VSTGTTIEIKGESGRSFFDHGAHANSEGPRRDQRHAGAADLHEAILPRPGGAGRARARPILGST
jgi:hypothetical protein